jgi:predicted nucleic acid-binding protein
MKPYPDANILVRLYLDPDGSGAGFELTQSAQARASWPFPVTTLLRLEVINAFRQMVFAARQAAGQFRVTRESADAAVASFEADLAAARFLRPTLVSLEELEEQFDALSARHTPRHGFRTYDILHVASALVLGCDTFWSYDKKALKLASLEGLKTNL